MPRSMAMPTAPATRKASGTAMTSDQSNSPGACGADHLLHDEGRVGAEHHHLAMRHVDDAHHAEGDGEADGGEQQHRAERNAVPDVLRRVPQRAAGARSLRCAASAASATSRASLARARGESSASASRSPRAASVSMAATCLGSGGVGSSGRGRGAGLASAALAPRVGLGGERRVEQRRAARRRRSSKICAAAASRRAGIGAASASACRARCGSRGAPRC